MTVTQASAARRHTAILCAGDADGLRRVGGEMKQGVTRLVLKVVARVVVS